MAEICVFYSHKDEQRADALIRILRKHGWSVWWDPNIKIGQFPQQIEAAILECRVALVLWSRDSVSSKWVVEEANFAQTRGKPLIPIRLDQALLPLGFTTLQTYDLSAWRGGNRNPELERTLDAVRDTLASDQAPATRSTAPFVDKSVTFPCFLRSVSSFETLLRPDVALGIQALVGVDGVLLSAYDVSKPVAAAAQDLRKRSSTLVVLDSGNYEASRRLDKKWTRKRFVTAVQESPADVVFCYDDVDPTQESSRALAEAVLRDAEKDRRALPGVELAPILHAPKGNLGRYRTDLLPEAFLTVAGAFNASVLAVPERELGDGIVQRVQSVMRIRSALSALPHYQPIHLLGTGNPISIALFSAAGADTFDGLEWCRTVADSETGLLYHPQQYDFFRWQAQFGTELLKKTTSSASVPFSVKVAIHNLEFYSQWMGKLKKARNRGFGSQELSEMLPKGIVEGLRTDLAGLFKK